MCFGNTKSFGAGCTTSNTWDGEIDEMRFYDQSVSDAWANADWECQRGAVDGNDCITVQAEGSEPVAGSTKTVSDEIALEDQGATTIADGIVTVTDEIVLEDAGTVIFGDGIVTVTDEIALEDQGATTIGSGIVTVTDEIVLEDVNINAGTNAIFVTDEIALEDTASRSTTTPITTFNAIILSLNSPLLDRLGGVFALTCPFNHTLTGLLTNGTLICTDMDVFFP